MIEEKKDFDLLWKMTEGYRKKCPAEHLQQFLDGPCNLMLVDGENVGLATFEYPGMYNTHWFFEVRGRKALNMGRAMLDYLFRNTDAKAVRGMIDVELRASKWAARQIGGKSLGIMKPPSGDYELFYMTKDDFYKEELNG